jgi:hypothetical protein
MCNLYSLTKGQAVVRDWFRASHDRTGNLPLFPGIFPDQMAPSFATEPTASGSLLWRVGACRVPLSLAARRSPTFAMSAARTSAAGSASITAASCRRLRFASTPIPGRARRRKGSRSAKTDRCSRSPVCGPLGAACEDRRAGQWMGNMSCSAFSRQKRMPPWPRSIRRRCRLF